MASNHGQFEQTVELASPTTDSQISHPAVALVEGSDPGISHETNLLLATRLKIASLLMFGGFLVFFIQNLFYLEKFQSTAEWVLFWDHLTITLITGVVGLRLCTDCMHVRKHLRIVELAVFGGSATFFFFLSYVQLRGCVSAGFVSNMLTPWLMLIFLYALFIPNSWRRASIIIGAMAASPLLVMFYVRFTSDNFVRIVTEDPLFRGFEFETIVMSVLAAISATWGVKIIGSLRETAYEAKRIGQYRLKHLIGTGGMGEVYLAEHVMLKRPLALKLIRPEKAGDPQAIARFEREVQATARLTHWNTIEIFDYGRAEDATFYYAMEYLPGMNLEQLIDMHGPMEPARVIHLLSQACDALSESHAQGLIHRDVKPANIFAARRGHVYDTTKLLDFGLVKPLARLQEASFTQEGAIAGSPLYMAPEQITGEAADARSDIYSMGAVAFFLITGQRLFQDENPMKVLIAHSTETPRNPADLVSDLSPELNDVVLRCLEKSPEDRFPNAQALRSALLRCPESGGWTRDDARIWWQSNGCPDKRELDAEVFHLQAAAAVG